MNGSRLLALSVAISLLAAIALARVLSRTAVVPPVFPPSIPALAALGLADSLKAFPAPSLAQTARLPSAVLPNPPQVFLNTTYTPSAGRTISVLAGGDFQAALNAAIPGDVIVLQAGATYSGTFTLRNKAGTGWIYIQSSALASFPPPGTRVSPAQASLMPHIVSPDTGPTIVTDAGAHNYRFVGVEITTRWNSTAFTDYGVIVLESPGGNTALSQVPTDIVFDRCYIHGTPTGNVRRAIAMNSARTAVIDSYLSEIHEVGADTQALASWNGPGPFKIVNNYLEAAGENVMFGGAGPVITNLVPSDIEIRGNYFFKPLTWMVGNPAYAGIHWSVKNLLEFKNAQRVLVDGNVFEHNWPDAQSGYAILFTVRGGEGGPWVTVRDIAFTHNIVRHVGNGVDIQGYDDLDPALQTVRVLVQNNLFADVNGATWGGDGRLFLVIAGTDSLVIDHNTAFQSGEMMVATTQTPFGGALIYTNTNFVFTNMITPENTYGFSGDGMFGNHLLTLNTYFPGAVFRRNALIGSDPTTYPADNFFPANIASVQFVNYAGGDYHLAASSPYKNAGTDGRDAGVDFGALLAATANAITGGGL